MREAAGGILDHKRVAGEGLEYVVVRGGLLWWLVELGENICT